MLTCLSIRDVVLIDRLDLELEPGLGVLTGETGAGKSILLDALGLALGVRAESRLVRSGARRSAVTASFSLPKTHDLWALLDANGLGYESDEIILRRTLTDDGRSKAFVNDQPVSVGLLSQIGDALVEIHGQFESQRLLNQSFHRVLLDSFGGFDALLTETGAAFEVWSKKAAEHRQAAADLETAKRDEEFLRHAVAELQSLGPEPGEETRLAEQRNLLMHAEQLVSALNEARRDMDDGDSKLQRAARTLGKVADKAQGTLNGVIEALDRAINENADAANQLDRALGDLDVDPGSLDRAEERLFSLRALARKHGCAVDDLADLAAAMAAKLDALDDGSGRLAELAHQAVLAKEAFVAVSDQLNGERKKAAQRMEAGLAHELASLKLEKARFVVEINPLEEGDWSANGCDRVTFLVATNPGTPPGPLNKIASGGEMARFMLALKVVLAEADSVPTLVFDEVDAGVGGAVAAAVGERLARLAENAQVLVVTHSPQVAARGKHHWRVSKSEDGDRADGSGADDAGRVWTHVDPLARSERKEEIARMLAGATVTEEARAAADSLLAGGGP